MEALLTREKDNVAAAKNGPLQESTSDNFAREVYGLPPAPKPVFSTRAGNPTKQPGSDSVSGNAATALSVSAPTFVYHGTPSDFQQVVPKPNRRVSSNGEIKWSGDGVFATNDRRIAMIYTAKREPDYSEGVNLIDRVSPTEPVTLYVSGGHSQEEALAHLYGNFGDSKGYIHMLDKNSFKWENGLGQMEVVSRTIPSYYKSPPFPTGIQTVNPRQEIQRYVDQGLMKLLWQPGD